MTTHREIVEKSRADVDRWLTEKPRSIESLRKQLNHYNERMKSAEGQEKLVLAIAVEYLGRMVTSRSTLNEPHRPAAKKSRVATGGPAVSLIGWLIGRKQTGHKAGGSEWVVVAYIGTIVLVVVAGLGLEFALIAAGVAGRWVAKKMGQNNQLTLAIIGVIPSLPMVLGYWWYPAIVAVVHFFLWKEGGDAGGTSGKGDDETPDEM